MQIPKKKIQLWARLKEHGDIAELADSLKMDKATISRVVSGHQGAKSDTILAIDRFFKARKKVLKQLTEDQD